jgi:general stress protein 26
MNHTELSQFLRTQKWAVVSTVTAQGAPQAAVMVFDTLASTRKVANLRLNPRIALVIGGLDGADLTVQYEGLASFPADAELEPLKRVYLAAFPEGLERQSWPGILYVRVKPLWLRFSNFAAAVPVIHEFRFD